MSFRARFLLFILFSISFNTAFYAQADSLRSALERLKPSQAAGAQKIPGEITVHHNGAVDSLEIRDRGRREIEGYRIQIYLGDFAGAKTTRSKFISSGFPLNAYPVQLTPNYAVRVGDFKTLLEAHKYLEEVRKSYPGAFVVADQIEPPRLVPRD